MVTLSHRLKTILSEISAYTCADIGCDHGKLIVSALSNNKIKIGYAIDISPDSLKKAEKLAQEENVLSRLYVLCGDGGSVLPQKVDFAVIAGMGANEIIHILSERDFSKKYLLSPHQDAQLLRRFLAKNDFYIIKDYIIFDKKYYPIIIARKGKNNYLPSEMFFGKNKPKTDAYDQYVLMRKNIIQKIKDQAHCDLNEETEMEWREITECCKKK